MFKTISLFCTFIAVGAFSIAQVADTDLESIARSKDSEYLVRKSSITVDPDELTVEFELHTRFDTPVKSQGKFVKRVVERALIVCPQRTFIVTEQLWYDEKDQQIGGARSSKVYRAKMTALHNGLIDYVCGSTQPSNQKRPNQNDDLT